MTMAVEQAGLSLPQSDWIARRERAFRAAARHTYAVLFLRVVLPVLALVALSAYVIYADFSIKVGNLTATISGVQLQRDRLTMLNPLLEGASKEGGEYRVQADRAIQNVATPEIVGLENIVADVTQPSGDRAKLLADEGTFHTQRQRLELVGNIRVTTSAGERAFLKRAKINMKAQTIATKLPVIVEMPAGRATADAMTINLRRKTLVFNGNVRVRLKGNRDKGSTGRLRGTNGAAQ